VCAIEPTGLKLGFAQPEGVTARTTRLPLLPRHCRKALHDCHGLRLGNQTRQSGNARSRPDEHLNAARVADDVRLAFLAAPDPQRNQAKGARKRLSS